MTTTSQRRRRILQLLMERGSVQVSELSPSFNVSTVTIRNDLAFFEEQGLVTRTYGGAYLKVPAGQEAAEQVSVRDAGLAARIGAKAAELLHPDESILVDAGPAMLELARCMRRMSGLTVMTNGLDVAVELADAQDIEVICTGGMLDKERFTFHGAQAEHSLSAYRFDKVFLGADGLGVREGITIDDESVARMKRRMIESAASCIIVTESSVFGQAGLHRVAPAERIDTIVTDNGLPEKYREALARAGVKLVLVD